MPSQLRVLEDGSPAPQDRLVASFRADARLRLWGAGLCACVAIVFTALGYARSLPAIAAGPIAAAFVLWAIYLAITFTLRRAVRYTLSTQRLEIERGILGKRFESIELWRVRDVVLDQTLLERVRGVGRITVYSTDHAEPELTVGPAQEAKPLFDRLRQAVAAARREARVVPIDEGG